MCLLSTLLETITFDINPNVKTPSISSKERMFKFTNISLVLLRHVNLIKRRKLLLYATFNFFKAVLVQSNHIGAQYNVEQYVLNK